MNSGQQQPVETPLMHDSKLVGENDPDTGEGVRGGQTAFQLPSCPHELRGIVAIEVAGTMSKDKNVGECQSLGEKIKAGERLMERAKQALRRYRTAQETHPAREVEKLFLEAEALFAAVGEYQCQV
ncbi:MAG: hypothetical protein RR068_12085, partial [Hafnia sp.]